MVKSCALVCGTSLSAVGGGMTLSFRSRSGQIICLLLGLVATAAPASPGRTTEPAPGRVSPALLSQTPAEYRDYRRRLLLRFEQLDHDGDRILLLEDVRGQPLETRFSRFDSNGDGRLQMEEFVPASHPQFLGKRLRERFHAADHDGDGLLSTWEARTLPQLSARFSRLDSNGDGQLSLEEIWHSRQALAPQRPD
ncbi:MAG: hypothetical protein ERJ67_07550 [Aphanocapsa feldmannii 277cV]|uniref:EF-hand domain-containing protein n=1 Tax=Aphanocapsa feldmannii 277cV TaxID=2507553 RepID=A0A524RNL3_9CHRO|nr:MAG: hypothetical protein ERJ67_07550 [Aphanocapsa feldmannii 277cV]